uniref:Radical SAM protein n=1 Tax=Ignisphaera aggregans TaxID=334771 RepID=A0A7J2U3W3_9CREN
MTKTTIYHITYYDYDKSVYIQFLSCNFRCLGCIRRKFLWDHHLEDVERGLSSAKIELLEVEKLTEILNGVNREFGLKRAVLGGGEPTADPSFCNILKILHDLGLEVSILTNGYLLDKVLKCIHREDTLEIGIKSIWPERFAMYTSRKASDLNKVLSNIENAFKQGYKIIIETILIPEFNDAKDVEEVARFIATHLDTSTPLIIDEYIPVPTAPWRRPTYEELVEAKQRAEKHLKNVILRSSYTMKPKGKVYPIFPRAP